MSHFGLSLSCSYTCNVQPIVCPKISLSPSLSPILAEARGGSRQRVSVLSCDPQCQDKRQVNDFNSKVSAILWVPPDYSTSLRGGFPGPSPQLQAAAGVQALLVKSLTFPIECSDGVDVLRCVWVGTDKMQRPVSLELVNEMQRPTSSIT